MPLSEPFARRQRLHSRRVTYEGFQRSDGLFDMEGRITDVKDHDITLLPGVRRAGEPIHDMWVRVTIDRDFTVHDVEAQIDEMPYRGHCNRITPHYRALVGANLLHGFRKRLHETMGHVRGCTHLTELLGGVPTAAIQTFAGQMPEERDDGRKPFQLDQCHALETTGETVRRWYPRWYRRPE